MNKESIGFYVFEDARLNGTMTKQVGQLVQPEMNMVDEKPSESGRRSKSSSVIGKSKLSNNSRTFLKSSCRNYRWPTRSNDITWPEIKMSA